VRLQPSRVPDSALGPDRICPVDVNRGFGFDLLQLTGSSLPGLMENNRLVYALSPKGRKTMAKFIQVVAAITVVLAAVATVLTGLFAVASVSSNEMVAVAAFTGTATWFVLLLVAGVAYIVADVAKRRFA